MPFALAVIGLLLIVSGARGTYRTLGSLIVGDLTGTDNFFEWIAAIFIVGAIGYVPSAEKFSRVFLALVLVAMVLAHSGFIAKLQAAFANPQGGSAAAPDATTAAASTTATGAVGGIMNSMTQDAQTLGKFTSDITSGNYATSLSDLGGLF